MDLPPLFHPLASAGACPVGVAVAKARAGCDAGLVVYDITQDRLRAAVVFAPEVALQQAAVMLPLCGIGFQNALGALAPPEMAVQLEWEGALRLNGAVCGALSLTGPSCDPEVVPDWLVVGLDVALFSDVDETGLAPDVTTLAAEGCGDIAPVLLLAAWLRHTLVWLNTWEDDGAAALHREWSGLAYGTGADTIALGQKGRFTGVDEDFGMLLNTETGMRLLPLSELVKDAR